MKLIFRQLVVTVIAFSLTNCAKIEEWQSFQKQKKAVKAILAANGKGDWNVKTISLIRKNRIVDISYSESGLTVIPEEIGDLIYLESVRLSYNNLTTLPESFGNLVNLKSLELEHNQLTSLPESFGNLSNLEELSIQHNKLKTLPESFGNLHKLKELKIFYNELESLSDNFGELKNLNALFCGHNKLTSLPESFSNLDSLEYCRLSENSLTALPGNFHLKNLRRLLITDNKLTVFPESMAGMPVSVIEGYNNNFKVFPSVILKLPYSALITLGDSVDVNTIPKFYLQYRPNDIGGAFHEIGDLHKYDKYIKKVYSMSKKEYKKLYNY